MNKLASWRFSMPRLIIYSILIYPVFYTVPYINENIGYTFSNYYFIGLLFLMVILILKRFYAYSTLSISLNSLIFILLFVLIFFQANKFHYIKPLVFLIYVVIYYVYLSGYKIKRAIMDNIPFFMYLFLLLSFAFLLSSSRYTSLDRFTGFVGSPTVYAVFLDAIFIFYLFTNTVVKNKIIVFFVILFLSIFSETRLNILFLSLIPIILFALTNFNSRKFRCIVLTIFILVINLIYPTYQYYIENTSDNLFAERYDEGIDSSFRLRYQMYQKIIMDYDNSDIQDIILGKGLGYSRQLIIREFTNDLLPHNDFLRFFVDFGLIAAVLFFIVLFRISIKNNLSLLLAMLYFLSFFHNMIYSYYLISLVIFASFICNPQVMGLLYKGRDIDKYIKIKM